MSREKEEGSMHADIFRGAFATDRLIVPSRKSDGIITYHLHHETGEAVFDASR
jgi:hypothetical protein